MQNAPFGMTLAIALVCLAIPAAFTTATAADARALGIPADGKTDATPAVRQALDAGDTDLFFPAGDYLLGPLKIPAESRLVFSPKARIRPLPGAFDWSEEVEVDGKKRTVQKRHPLFTITGDNVRIEGLRHNFADGGQGKIPFPFPVLIRADGVKNLSVSGIHAENTSAAVRRGDLARLILLDAADSQNILLADSFAENISHMVRADRCANVTVRGNRMTGGDTITTFANGGESLRHHDNWSRQVVYQCVWRGGSPDPSRKHPRVPHGTAGVVFRGPPADGETRPAHTHGVFDVLVQNNYAEYGTVLCWGNKGRQTIIDGNIARFMWDYAYGSEGGENLVFSNNISINSAVAGFMVMYWSEKVLITGNLVLVRHEPFDAALTPHPRPGYLGQFVRLHHGPPNPEDRYGAGSVHITGNLFVNELADRPSGISVEAGRDVLFSGNKVINGFLRKADELALVKETEAHRDMDEFAAQRTVRKEDGVAYRILRRVGADPGRVTVTGNEFILRQPGDKPAILVNGSVSNAIVKDNVIRKEPTHIAFTDEQRETEKTPSRYTLWSQDDFENRDLTRAKPATAIGIDPFTSGTTLVQGNIVQGWRNAITAQNTTRDGRLVFVLTGNTTDGDIAADGPVDRTTVQNTGNLRLPAPGL